MSKKDEKASDAAHADQNTDSVYDFLYCDARLIGSFLSQFDELGHLQQITATDNSSKGVKRGYSVKLSGNVPVPGSPEGAEGALEFGRNPGQMGSESLARAYDPLWSNALSLLDFLDERALIKKDLGSARIGQFIIAKGTLSIIDFATVAKIWTMPSLRRQWGIAELPHGKRKGGDSNVSGMEVAADFIPALPHGIQLSMISASRQIWGSLREDAMIVSASDLMLKHGATVAGEWSVLGILDAKPDAGGSLEVSDNLGLRIATEGFGVIMTAIAPFARQLLGRRDSAFGVTPLLVFREVGS